MRLNSSSQNCWVRTPQDIYIRVWMSGGVLIAGRADFEPYISAPKGGVKMAINKDVALL